MDIIKPSELRTAARVSEVMVYVAGVAGALGGGLLFTDGQTALALVAWALTFVAGALLQLLAWAARALALLLQRTDRIERALEDRHAAEPAGPEPPSRVPDPYRRWGGRH